MALKETTKLRESGCGEEPKFLRNGKSTRVTITSPSKNLIREMRLFKTSPMSTGLISMKMIKSKEDPSLMPNGSNDHQINNTSLNNNQI
jgi:hypothetical protein